MRLESGRTIWGLQLWSYQVRRWPHVRRFWLARNLYAEFGFSRKALFTGLRPENPRFSLGEKSTEGFPRSAYKPKMQFHMGIYTSDPRKWAFFLSFLSFWPLGFWDWCEKTHAKRRFSAYCTSSPKVHSSGFVFLQSSFFATSDTKIPDLAWGKKVRRVFPDRLISKQCSFIWKFTGRTLENEYFSVLRVLTSWILRSV